MAARVGKFTPKLFDLFKNASFKIVCYLVSHKSNLVSKISYELKNIESSSRLQLKSMIEICSITC